jgi:hypothetical protein
METWSKWKLVKAGFWLGIGFIIPQLLVLYGGTILTIKTMTSTADTPDETEMSEVMSDMASDFDRSGQIKILKYHDKNNSGKVLILGAVENVGKKSVSSIELEAELTDKNGEFVYECSTYISRTMKPGDTENFQIKCGCGNDSIPAYNDVTVRVVSAHGF